MSYCDGRRRFQGEVQSFELLVGDDAYGGAGVDECLYWDMIDMGLHVDEPEDWPLF